MNISNTGYEVPVSLVTRRDDVQMYSFLKKGLASIKDQDIHEALIVNGYENPEMNVRQFLQKHVILVLLVLAVVIAEKISGREYVKILKVLKYKNFKTLSIFFM